MQRAAAALLILVSVLTGALVAALPTRVGAATSSPGRIVYVAANDQPPSSDRPILRLLDEAGHDVEVIDDDDFEAAFIPEVDDEVLLAVVISSSVDPRKIDDGLGSVDVPIVTWEHHLFEDLGLAAEAGESSADHTEVELVDPDHPLASEIEDDVPVVMNRPAKLTYGIVAASADVVATVVDQPRHAVIFTYATGDVLPDDTEAASCRVGFFATYRGGRHLSDDGLALAGAAIEHALACDTDGEPPAGAGVERSVRTRLVAADPRR